MRALFDSFLHRALDAMASGSPASALLRDFAITLESALPGCIVGINVLDKPGRMFRHSIFPSLADDFSQSLENTVITGKRGSCGLGILTGKTIEVPDVANDERFSAEWKALFQRFGLTSLVSIPAMNNEGIAQGSIAVIHPFNAPPGVEQKALMQEASALGARLCAYSRTQETTALLIGEMEHRVRNLFQVIGGVADLTIRRYPDPQAFRRMFGERLMMMHRAHTLAFSPSEIDIHSLLKEVLAPFANEREITCSGPEIVLARDAASALALVANELGTNAAKYGSLSRPEGTLSVHWALSAQTDTEPETFSFTWQEAGGPPVQAPVRKGYGTTLIRGTTRNAFDGTASLTFDPTGFCCNIRAAFTDKVGKKNQ